MFSIYAAIGALGFYLLTLSHGLTLNSLPLTAKLAGWDSQPLVGQPLLWLLTLPLRALPASWVPAGLNLLAAVFAALTLGLLIRCLELMPWPRPLTSLNRWQRLLPSLLALAVCGLQFDFWQSAISAPGDTLDVLLLAIPVWCLMEFRSGVSRSVFEERWVAAAVFFWGLGMAQNWMMLPALPVFLAALFLCHPLGLLQGPMRRRLAGLGLAGFSLYALLPLANGLWPGSPWGLGESWLMSLQQTKHLLGGVWHQFGWSHRLVGLAVVIFYLVPGLAGLVRMQDENTSGKLPVDQVQIWFFRALRIGLLLLCVWLALDPVIGPRAILRQQMNLALPLLSFDFINGLGAGFLAGNLLLMRRERDPADPPFDPFEIRALSWLEHAALPLVLGLTLAATAGLAARNGPAITSANRRPLIEFGEMAVRSLPPGGGILLVETPEKLQVFQAAQARHAAARDWLPLEFSALPNPDYRDRLERQSPGNWLVTPNRHTLTPIELIQLLDGWVRTNRVFYLQPGFHPVFEAFYPEPSGLVCELKPFLTNTVNAPTPTPEQRAENAVRWTELLPSMTAVAQAHPVRPPTRKKSLEQRLKLSPVPDDQDRLLAEWYSMARNSRGVELQRAGELAGAQDCFLGAMELNTNNWIARANLFCNTNLQAGNRMGLNELGRVAAGLGNMKNFSAALGRFGPVDEAAFCFLLGNVCAQSALLRLAMQNYERAAALAPEVPAPQLALAVLYIRCQLPTQAGNTLARLREAVKNSPSAGALDTEISFVEADLQLAQTNPAAAQQILIGLIRKHPADAALAERVWPALLRLGSPGQALAVIAEQVDRKPDDIPLLLTQAGLLVQSGQPGPALPVLNHLLKLTNLPPARLNRAIAQLQLTNYPAAKADFLALTNSALNPFAIHFGLAEIALHEGDTNGAMEQLQRCVASAPPGSPQGAQARARLEALAGSAP